MTNEHRCPKCDSGRLKWWNELSEEEQEVVKRLPEAVNYSTAERQKNHRWCTRCWHEATNNEARA